MSNRNPRNHQLLSQIAENNPFKKTVVPRAFDIGRDFEMDVEAVGLDRRLSPEAAASLTSYSFWMGGSEGLTERRLLQICAVRRHIEFDAGRAAA